jgi:hypothetical protein
VGVVFEFVSVVNVLEEDRPVTFERVFEGKQTSLCGA